MTPLERIKYIEDAGLKPLIICEYKGKCIADVVENEEGDISVGTMPETDEEKDALIRWLARMWQDEWMRTYHGKDTVIIRMDW